MQSWLCSLGCARPAFRDLGDWLLQASLDHVEQVSAETRFTEASSIRLDHISVPVKLFKPLYGLSEPFHSLWRESDSGDAIHHRFPGATTIKGDHRGPGRLSL